MYQRHATVSACCTVPEFMFILSTNFLDYTFKLSILLLVCVKYSQLEIMNECCFSLSPMISRLSIVYTNVYYVWSVPSCDLFSGITLVIAERKRASDIIRYSISKAPILCSTNDSGCELVLPYKSNWQSVLFTSFLSGYDSLHWPQAPHLLICSVNVALRIYCELNYTAFLFYFVLAIHFSLLWVNQRSGKSSLLKKKPTCSNICVSNGDHPQCKEIPHEVRHSK